jgi:hypothetical protein
VRSSSSLGVDGANPSRIAAVDFDVFSGDDVEGSQQKIRDSMIQSIDSMTNFGKSRNIRPAPGGRGCAKSPVRDCGATQSYILDEQFGYFNQQLIAAQEREPEQDRGHALSWVGTALLFSTRPGVVRVS